MEIIYEINSIFNEYTNETQRNYLIKAFDIREKLDDNFWIAHSYGALGHTYRGIGNYNKALVSYSKALKIHEQEEDKYGIGWMINSIGIINFDKSNYEKAVEYLEKSSRINKQINGGYHLTLWNQLHLNLTYKYLGKTNLIENIDKLITGSQDFEYLINFPVYQFLEDTSYLETAYNQVQEKASAMDEELAKKFISYPIPKTIVEEWEKVK